MSRPAFAGHGAATLLVIGTALLWMVLEARQSLNRRADATEIDQRSLVVIRLLGVAAALVAAVAIGRAGWASFGYSVAILALGLVLAWTGIALRWWSFRTLGRYFTFVVMTSPDQKVVTGGPYRWLRHPSYTGILLVLTGLGVLYGNWIALAALVIGPLGGVLFRIHVEEAALSRALGPAYTDFARSRKRIIPFVW